MTAPQSDDKDSPVRKWEGEVMVPRQLLAEIYRGLKRHYEMLNERKMIDALLSKPVPELGTSSAAQELSALWDGRVPSDPAAAIAKMLGKLDEADKETFNWLAAGFRQVGANWAEARTARSTSGAWISAENKPERDGLYLVRDIDGQMAFASFTARYGWEHVADVDCGAVTAWHPLPTERTPASATWTPKP